MRTFTALLVLTLLSACTTTKPSSDSTSPTLTWTVVNRNTNETQTFETSGKFSAKVGDEFRITLTARDPEGVHKLRWTASTDFTCGNSLVNDDGVQFDAVDTFEPNGANEVLTAVPFIRNVTIVSTACAPGAPFEGGNTAVIASTENHFSGVTKGVLNIGIQP